MARKKYVFENLGFEVTRRCNLSCDHCLRGCAEDIDIQKGVIDTVLDSVAKIEYLVFTGGEPALNVPMIQYILEQMKARDIPLGMFFIATNGIPNQMELARVCLDLMQYAEEPFESSIAISRDIFHDNVDEIDKSPLNFLAIRSDCKDAGDFSQRPLGARGRAAVEGFSEKYNVEVREQDVKTEFENIWFFNHMPIIGDIVYISARGQVCLDCDLSYDMMDAYKVCDVQNFDEVIEKAVANCKTDE